MEQKFCPYPGLRPFNEEESIFFKGRDTQVSKVVSLLEKNKFLMITGASGDGKSSLTYAGLIPNARAGFFKAKFNNWRIADFRPERTPLENLSQTLSKALQISLTEVEQAVKAGFSSLVNLYKKSKWHVDYLSDEWLLADETKKRSIKRQGANVLILVDQFEEFFTNQENFTNGIPSVESQLVMNVLLETAKIAHSQDLPIYVVCTMRSDYIGQCAAFRGLPEMIGFSQFFVPRLKRKEIQQVITEPAKLAGCQITTRLSETLINELGSGFDQLPVLQHALNQLWQLSYGATGNGKEMDLLSLAKLGGISTQTLNEEEKKEFEKWESKISTYKKKYLKNPSLENVLNAHADELYENAADYYNASQGTKISEDTAKQIIKIAFQCLVKTDEGRTVRSRMTLTEITKIINIHSIDEDTVAGVLEIFRLQGNTFLKPYKDEQDKLERNTVLDITHESLIRNWARLKEWAKEEYEDYQTYLDFNKQLQRWLANNKSSGYLLPIGPLTYFENWYQECQPNANWLARYDDREIEHEQKIVDAEENLKQAQHFIKKSANKLFFSRTVLKYGANNILAVAAIFVLICSCTYFYFDYRKKQNDYVLETIEKEGLDLLKNSKIKKSVKARFIVNYERLHPGMFSKILESFKSDTLSFDLSLEIFLQCENIENTYDRENPFLFEVLNHLDNTLQKIHSNKVYPKNDTHYKRFISFVRLCLFIQSYYPQNKKVAGLIEKYTGILGNDYVVKKLNSDSSTFDPLTLNNSIDLIVCRNNINLIDKILKKLSPFENEISNTNFNKNFDKKNLFKLDYSNSITHNAGYIEMAYCYGATGNAKKVEMCLDSIYKYNNNFSNLEYNNFYTIFLLLKSKTKEDEDRLNLIINKFIIYSELNSSFFYKKLLENTTNKFRKHYIKTSKYRLATNYFLINTKDVKFLSNLYEKTINDEVRDENTRNFELALLYKFMGFQHSQISEMQKEFYKKSYFYFSKLETDYLNSDYVIGAKENKTKIKRSIIYLYPGLVNLTDDYNPFSNRGIYSVNTTFFNFLIENEIFDKCYLSKEHWEYFNYFLDFYYRNAKIYKRSNNSKFNSLLFDFAEKNLKFDVSKGGLDSNFIYLVKCNYFFEQTDTSKAFIYFNKTNKPFIKTEEFQKDNKKQEMLATSSNEVLIKMLAQNFANYRSNPNLAIEFAMCIKPSFKVRNCLIEILLNLNEKSVENTFVYLDTLQKLLVKEQKVGLSYFEILGGIGGKSILNLAIQEIKDQKDNKKARAFLLLVKGICKNRNYFLAKSTLPNYFSPESELEIFSKILNSEAIYRISLNEKNFKTKNYPFKTFDDELGIESFNDLEDDFGGDIYFSSDE